MQYRRGKDERSRDLGPGLWRTSENAVKTKFRESSRHSREAFSTMPHPPKPRHIGQAVYTRGSIYATCHALRPFAAHRRKGRGLETVVYC
jgi:hypothetical protein